MGNKEAKQMCLRTNQNFLWSLGREEKSVTHRNKHDNMPTEDVVKIDLQENNLQQLKGKSQKTEILRENEVCTRSTEMNQYTR